MYNHNPGCSCSGMDREIYRGEIYDICRARLGRQHGRTCEQLKFVLLGVTITAVFVLLVSCCLR